MKIPQRALPVIRTVILLTFIAVSLFAYAQIYIGAGGKIPPFNTNPYAVTFQSPINKNLVNTGQVTQNGVIVGAVQNLEVVGGLAQIEAGYTEKPEIAPLHEGVRATIKTKTLINETYLDITDGTGAPLPTGTVLPVGNVEPPVDTDEVVRALPQEDRKSLSGAVQSLDAATRDNQSGISQTVGSLGTPLNYIPSALKALADQEAALRQLSTNTAGVLNALDTRQGQIAELVENADTVTKVTSGSRQDLEAVIQKLTPTLRTAQAASPSLSLLGAKLQPVARNLNEASGPLNEALAQLPATSKDLRDLLPALDETLDKLPPTLRRVPRFARDVRELVPNADGFLTELNPIAAYIKPCGPNIVPFLNFGKSVNGQSPNGPLARVGVVFGADSPTPPVPGGPMLAYQVGNNPTAGSSPGAGNPNSNVQCKTPFVPYSR